MIMIYNITYRPYSIGYNWVFTYIKPIVYAIDTIGFKY